MNWRYQRYQSSALEPGSKIDEQRTAATSSISQLVRRVDLFRAIVVCGLFVGATSTSQAEHARIDMRVSRQGEQGEVVTSTADVDTPAGGYKDPPVLEVKVNEPLVLQFVFTNTYPHKVIEGVSVRYYVVRAAKLGRQRAPSFRERTEDDKDSLPLLEKGVVTRGQFTMDFKPDCRVGTRLTIRLTEPGIYIARVDSLNTQSDHEHFSAIDLVAE
ncbi:MAG: hypothetical protein WD875_19230 [Pirellulales bacterium]